MHPTFALALVAFSSVALAAEPVLVWETSGFVAPESVVFDPTRNEFFVSNMGTHGPEATPDDGFISRMSLDGELRQPRWAVGLQNPKGLAIAQGHLFVGDDDALVVIELATGRITARHAPDDGPGGFNDCTADEDGNVYVCSGRLATVFRWQAGQFEPWVKLDPTHTGGINGLLAERDRLLLGGWSLRDAEGREQLGHLSTVSFADRSVGRLGTQPICHIDGIEPDGRGGYTVTDWLTGAVLHVSADGEPMPLLQLERGTADHEYLVEPRLLIVPLMNDNLVRAYRWAPDAS